VPHIFAASPEDAYAALGFVHAQDRLWQMEMTRRLGAGRLSEIFGEASLPFDRYARTFGLYRLAEAQVARLKPEERKLLDAYARGVNAYLKSHSGALPPEFVLLQHEPEPWQPADSLVWARIMAMRLSRNWGTELLRWRLARRLDPAQIRQLWPDEDGDAPITLSDRVRSAMLPLDGLAAAIPDAFTSADASNAWAVSGDRTSTGKPVLANDPHLGFGAPILWYLAHVEAPGLSLTGATVPGVPLMILGHNGRIAWGMTTTGGDLEDLYLEDVDPADPDRYLTPDGPKPFATRTEEIKVRGKPSVMLTVRATRHGPVISDLVGKAKEVTDGDQGGKQVVALASAALRDDDDTARALLRINTAADWSAFVDAARDFTAPQQNLFFADTKGDIGLIAPARVPIRRSGNGLAPVSGADAAHDWTGFVPFDALPRTHNPPGGVIVNANNRLVGPSYPNLITKDWDSSWRAIRIEETLAGEARHDVPDAAALQMDTLSTAARRLVPLLLAAPASSPRAKAAIALLRGWDYRMQRDKASPLIYAAWVLHLMETVAADELGPMYEEYARPRPNFLLAVLTRNRRWCDEVTTKETESCDDRIALALDRSLDDIARTQGDDMATWRWGKAHRADFVHRLFSRIPLADRLVEMSVATDGGDNTVNRGQTVGFGPTPYRHTHGAGFRAVYDLADLARSRFIIATGQSGNPFSPHYRDQLERWRDGGHIGIAVDRDSARERAAATLLLVPRPAR
jgi:penicillin amidase